MQFLDKEIRMRFVHRAGLAFLAHIFRREGGSWKLIHRHADPLLEKAIPGAVPKASPGPEGQR